MIGISVRLIALGSFPAGLNQDEAYSGYEAYSLLRYGFDSWGYSNPVHLTAWGSGMNALYVYLALIPVRLFGLSVFSVRLVQAVFGCLALIFFYLLCKKTGNRKIALLGLFILAINPWHIMLSRWACDSNLVVFFLLAGVYFFILGMEKRPYLILSALFYGLSLYAYPTVWVTLPFIIGLQVFYGIYCKKLTFTKSSITAIGVFGILAIPLLLFVLVNYDFIPEIRTRFISIPKLVAWRSSYFSGWTIGANIYHLLGLLFFQRDGGGYNALPWFGMYYLFSAPLILWGFIFIIKETLKKSKTREFFPPVMILLQFIGSLFFLATLSYPNINRVNIIHLPLLFCNVYGIVLLWRTFKSRIGFSVIALYAISFVFFTYSYFTAPPVFSHGYQQALHRALSTPGKTVYIKDLRHPVFLFESKYPTDEFVSDVQYANYPNAYLQVSKTGRYRFAFNSRIIDNEGVYVFSKNRTKLIKRLETNGFRINLYDEFVYAERIQ
jgi:hypothetical protein